MINLINWDIVDNKFTFPDTPKDKNNWYNHGFFPKNDYSVNLSDYFGIRFDIDVKKLILNNSIDINKPYNVKVKIGYLDSEALDSEIIEYFNWDSDIIFSDTNTHTITAQIEQFDFLSSRKNLWRYVRDVEFNVPVKTAMFIMGDSIAVYPEDKRNGKSSDANEIIDYNMIVENCRDIPIAVKVNRDMQGWEVTDVTFSETTFTLSPFEKKHLTVSVKMSERICFGGYENQLLNFIVNGKYSLQHNLISTRTLPHPYLLHNEEGWNGVIEKTEKYEWAKDAFETKKKIADEWSIPELNPKKDYLYETENAHHAYTSAIVWKLNGDESLLDKATEFLKRVAYNYPKTLKACSQELVHEGEFFKSISVVYDLTCDSGKYTYQDKNAILNTFTIFMGRIDWALEAGSYSNWTLAEIAGALNIAAILQDRTLINRFVYGSGGILDHLSKGVLDDGWWFECSIGYNQMSAALFTQYIKVLEPWGINIKSISVPANFSDDVQSMRNTKDGLTSGIYGPCAKNYRNIEMIWDSLLSMADYRGVVPGVNDSAESKLAGGCPRGDDSRYDIAYNVYKKHEYADIIRLGGDERDLIFGEGELPEVETDIHRQSCYFDNAGVAMLRSNTPNRPDREQIQASLKYGSHGGAHGHYDRCSLLSLSRYGRSFYNPENIWYSYHTFMYKFFVQTSITHNMVQTDLKMQDPKEGRRLYFESNDCFNASAVENYAKWSHPPYGGWRVGHNETFAERCFKEGRYVPIPENPPEYTKRTGFTEPIMQRRLTVVTDDVVLNFDYVKGDTEHDFDCVYHIPGLKDISGDNIKFSHHSEKLTDDPLSSGQFVTDCETYDARGNVKLKFFMMFDEKTREQKWLTPFRTAFNEDGPLNMDLYYLGSENNEEKIIIGNDPQYQQIQKKMWYEIKGDGKKIKDGSFGAWILGRDDIELDISGMKEITLKTKVENPELDLSGIAIHEKSLYWGDPYILTNDNIKIYLSSLEAKNDNILLPTPKDESETDFYTDGPVKIQGKLFENAVGAEPKSDEFGSLSYDISELGGVKLFTSIGSDYPISKSDKRRRMVSRRATSDSAVFISVLDFYEDKTPVKNISLKDNSAVVIELENNITQIITAKNMDGDGNNVIVEFEEYKDGKLTRKA